MLVVELGSFVEEGPLCSPCPTHKLCRSDFPRSAALVFHSDVVGECHLHFGKFGYLVAAEVLIVMGNLAPERPFNVTLL